MLIVIDHANKAAEKPRRKKDSPSLTAGAPWYEAAQQEVEELKAKVGSR